MLLNRPGWAAKLLVLCLPCVAAWGNRIFYAAPDGNDANPGTVDKPFGTVTVGARVLTPGDTLYLRGGAYLESLINITVGGTSWAKPVTIAGYPGESAVIRPPSSAIRALYVNNNAEYVVFDSLTFDGSSLPLSATDIIKIEADDASHNPHHVRIQNSEVRNGGAILTVQLTPATSGGYNEFLNLDVHDSRYRDPSGSGGHGFYISSSNNLIDRCAVHDNGGWGIQVYSGWCSISGNRITNNKVYNNARAPANGYPGDGRGWGIGIYSGPGHIVSGNIVWGNNGGVHIDYGATVAQVTDNLIYSNNGGSGLTAYGIYNGPWSVGAVIKANCVHSHRLADIRDTGGATIRDNVTNGQQLVERISWQGALPGYLVLTRFKHYTYGVLPLGVLVTALSASAVIRQRRSR
jgi:parallel beta-helix repeat protein